VAAIDFGTNTARLLVADRHLDGSFEQVWLEREIVRMGGGFSKEAGLSDEAIQRGSDCLARFTGILKRYGVVNPRAVATSAVRDAVNGREFVERIFRQTGIALSVIDGEQEGALTLAGVNAGLDCRPVNLMVFDVGGGSTEYTLVQSGKAAFIRSLPLGVVRLTEGKVSPAEMSEKIDRELELLSRDMALSGTAAPDGRSLLVGTAGDQYEDDLLRLSQGAELTTLHRRDPAHLLAAAAAFPGRADCRARIGKGTGRPDHRRDSHYPAYHGTFRVHNLQGE
jgi:exopolyphosphatase/guanosine-5'-triphosphate,3'-diphosphate pyrophosphatase